MCVGLHTKAKNLLDDGQGKETRTTVLWVATGVAAAATGVIALFLTDWSGENEKKPEERMDVFLDAAERRRGAGDERNRL